MPWPKGKPRPAKKEAGEAQLFQEVKVFTILDYGSNIRVMSNIAESSTKEALFNIMTKLFHPSTKSLSLSPTPGVEVTKKATPRKRSARKIPEKEPATVAAEESKPVAVPKKRGKAGKEPEAATATP